jgi:hypothetical protein
MNHVMPVHLPRTSLGTPGQAGVHAVTGNHGLAVWVGIAGPVTSHRACADGFPCTQGSSICGGGRGYLGTLENNKDV